MERELLTKIFGRRLFQEKSAGVHNCGFILIEFRSAIQNQITYRNNAVREERSVLRAFLTNRYGDCYEMNNNFEK